MHVLPSLREGFPNVVLQASAMGLPTVTTDATGAIDSVQECKTGLIVRTQDQRGLAEAIKTLIRDPGMALRYGVAARNWVVLTSRPRRWSRRCWPSARYPGLALFSTAGSTDVRHFRLLGI